MNNSEIEERVREILWPEPSATLRDRVLSSTVIARAHVTWSDRVWFSRGWRLAAVGAVLACGVLDQVARPSRLPSFAVPAQVSAEARAVDEAGREMGLPPEMAALLARRVLSDASLMRIQPPSASKLLQEFTREGGGDR